MATYILEVKEMMKENPHCHWCGREVKLYSEIRNQRIFPKGFRFPDDMAVFDHLYRRWEKNERQKSHMEALKIGSQIGVHGVLACKKCDADRSVKPTKTNQLTKA